ncbi:type IV pilus assembly protein PilM [Limisalsivibrio acetivorans]|uniref:type IV pilus assembly protein PilM n=1 Tax=Limisalsivibrio acetivorans TaxID=1304888 RepID=UPI0003B4E4EA|nr:type IV pilus assembly protein PilM [Limisalsivibrio acetivorans]
MFSSKQQLIGIDIGSSSVKLVELKPKRKGYTVKSAVEVPLTPDVIVEGTIMDYGEVTEAVTAAFKQGKFSTKDVATALKGNSVIAKRLTVPISDPDELSETFMWEAEQYIQMDIEDVSIDYEVVHINDEEGETDLVLAVARKDLIVDFKSVLEAAKLKPLVVDLEVFALMNCFIANYEVDEEASMIVNIGHSNTLLIFVRDGNYEFSREILKGGRNLTEMISQGLTVPYEEAEQLKHDNEAVQGRPELKEIVESFNNQIALEIKNTIEMYESNSQTKPSRCFLCGGVSSLDGLRERVEEVIEADASFFDPFARMDISGSVDRGMLEENLYSFNVAAGLALRSVKDK